MCVNICSAVWREFTFFFVWDWNFEKRKNKNKKEKKLKNREKDSYYKRAVKPPRIIPITLDAYKIFEPES